MPIQRIGKSLFVFCIGLAITPLIYCFLFYDNFILFIQKAVLESYRNGMLMNLPLFL